MTSNSCSAFLTCTHPFSGVSTDDLILGGWDIIHSIYATSFDDWRKMCFSSFPSFRSFFAHKITVQLCGSLVSRPSKAIFFLVIFHSLFRSSRNQFYSPSWIMLQKIQLQFSTRRFVFSLAPFSASYQQHIALRKKTKYIFSRQVSRRWSGFKHILIFFLLLRLFLMPSLKRSTYDALLGNASDTQTCHEKKRICEGWRSRDQMLRLRIWGNRFLLQHVAMHFKGIC